MSSSTDPSLRFVLPADAPYLRNLAALWAVEPALAAKIESLDGPSYPVEPSRSGPPTLALQKIYLHSRYDPLDEARRLVDPLDIDNVAALYVHGFGLGYHVETLFDRASDEAILFVFEPDLLLLRTAFEQRDLSKLIESRRMIFFCEPDKAALFTALTPRTAILSLGVRSLAHAPSLQLHPKFFEQMQGWLDELAAWCTTSMNTLVLNGRRTAQNAARNIGWYVASPGPERLKDRWRSQPAIVVSAGPSLRKNKHLLNDAAGRAVIIAVQTTLQPLLDIGIEPHFVTSLDYHHICTRFFEKLPRHLNTELVAEPKATSAIFELNPGPLTLLGNDFADGLLREMQLGKARLPGGSTVAHLAYYLAEHLGCDPIIFIGQDLGFSDGLCYAPGTSIEDVWRPELSRFGTLEMKQWEHIVRDRQILRKIPDYQGRPMYTEARLFTYLQQFERDFLTSGRRIIDATEGGARKRGTTSMPLAQAIAQFCKDPIPRRAEDHPGLRWERLAQCVESLRRRREEASQIEKIARQTIPLLQEIRDHLDDQKRVNRAIAAVDVLRAQMNELGPCYDLITQLTQQSELKRFQADRRIASAKLDAAERQRRQVERDVDNAAAVIDASKEFQSLMDEVVAQLSSRVQARAEAA